MSLYIFDTDHVTLHQRAQPRILARIQPIAPTELAVTVITVEEQLRGRLAQLNAPATNLALVYEQFRATVDYFCGLPILPFDAVAQQQYQMLRAQKIRIGTLDLRIAAIALRQAATLVTRNGHDFARVPNLRIEDWSI
jgi:tRNA(fMet)-specific endonuclease VapC